MVVHNLNPTLVARYFFFECPRYLGLSSLPLGTRQVCRLPPGQQRPSIAARFLTEQGERWEEEVVRAKIPDRVRMKAPPGLPHPGRQRFSPMESVTLLRTAGLGEYLFQPTLAPSHGLLADWGIDPGLYRFRDCIPDLLLVGEDDRIRVIDVKASEMLRGSHRVQVGLYAMVLDRVCRDRRIGRRADLEWGGVWLHGRDEPDWFELEPGLRVLRDFFADDLGAILGADPADLDWHLHYRCEWCPFYHDCRSEAEATRSVSLLPYLTVHARRYLREAPWPGGTPIETLDDLDRLLHRPDIARIFDLAGSLRHQEAAFRRALTALCSERPVSHDAVSIAFPRGEHVRLALTLQEDPVSGRIYAAGWDRYGGEGVFGSRTETRSFVARREEDCQDVVTAFLRGLYDLFRAVHDHNAAHAWHERLTVQTYVFDHYERELLGRLLHEAVGDPAHARMALALLFHYQDPVLVEASRHPGAEVLFPVIVLTGVLQRMIALPVPVSYGLPEVGVALDCTFVCRRDPAYWFDLSNRMKSDRILEAWHEGRPALADGVAAEVERRVRAASAVVAGCRRLLADRGLFAWPPRFRFPEAFALRAPELSRLAFIVRYEAYLAAIELRERRAGAFAGRVADGVSVPVVYRGGDRWEVEVPVDRFRVVREHRLDHDSSVSLLVPAGPEGERIQQGHDDLRLRSPRARPPRGSWYARVRAVHGEDGDGSITALDLRLTPPGPETPPPTPGFRGVLHPVAKDYTSDQVIGRLSAIDAEDDPPLLRLLRDPVGFCEPAGEDPGVAEAARRLARACGMTESQQRAFEQVLGRRLTLVWGPPGTGKTAFVAKALLALGRARAEAGMATRIAVSALTNAAIENVLDAVAREHAEQPPADDLLLAKLGEWRGLVPRPPTVRLLRVSQVTGAYLAGRAIAVVGGTGYRLDRLAGRGGGTGGAGPRFDLVVIDEASQLRATELALALTLLAPDGRLVLVGDHRQLPPITKGDYPPPADGLPGLEASVFSYLHARDGQGEQSFTRALVENWRMTETLCRFPAETIYFPAYTAANPDVAGRTLRLDPPSGSAPPGPCPELVSFLLAPEYPLAVAIFEDVRATVENRPEAGLITHLALQLRDRMIDPGTGRHYPPDAAGDRAFWRRGVGIVCPHHAQIHEIRRRLGALHDRAWVPFVDTVDRMQGQQSEVVLVSYGVSDVETALAEAAFIYSRNRLNVAMTRGRSKCVVCLSRPLLKAPPGVLEDPGALEGLSHMLALVEFARAHGEVRTFTWQDEGGEGAVRVTALRARVGDGSPAGGRLQAQDTAHDQDEADDPGEGAGLAEENADRRRPERPDPGPDRER